jgi:hypothetical protein
MANNDKLQQIISDIRILNDLTNSMMDTEIYPVSFFSQAFDLMQKIQSNFHRLEADQVELFTSQMKKHQALILSIHQQMRHIDASPTELSPNPSVPKSVPSPAAADPVPLKKKEMTGQEESKQKKVSFITRIGVVKKPETPEETIQKPAVNIAESATDPSPVVNTEELSGNASLQAITKTPSPVKKQTDIPAKGSVSGIPRALGRKKTETIRPSEVVRSETFKRTVKSTITIPELPPERFTHLPRQGVQTLSGINKKPETKTANTPNGIPTEGSAPPSVNDAIEKRKLSDLRKAFNLNDHFLYRRELFGGNEEVMNKVITALNSKTSYQESIRFLEKKLHWDFTQPTVKDFIKIVETRFL